MKKTRAISLLLSLTLVFAMLVPGTIASADSSRSDSGMVISKTATANTDGSYTITLEAYATGSKIISEVTEDVPTDIVLVLDQSGSMADPIGAVTFELYEDESSYWGTTYHTRNQDYYEVRANGDDPNLYYPLGDGAYASVSVQLEQKLTYTKITNGRNNSTQSGATNYWNNRNNLCALVNGEYLKVTVTRTNNNNTYTYTLPDGTVIGTSQGWNGTPTFTGVDGGVLYLASADESQNIYTYTYTDANGVTQTIGESTGATTVPGFTLYKRTIDEDAGEIRLTALKTAVTSFANSVAEKAKGADGTLGTDDDVNHRIAVVGFASGYSWNNGWYDDYYYYGNTEVFVGATQYTYNAGSANNASNAISAQSHYSEAFQDMSTSAGQENITASIDALDADGGTLTNLGMELANGILTANPVTEGETRNRVIIVFTDGAPGWSGYDSSTATAAINQANTAKGNSVTVYTVGIFSGADATSAGNENGDDTQKANWFMQNLSSNNGTVQIPSYYLSAADADTLNNIFQQISDQIETGGSSTTLSSATFIKDIIAPAFTLPEGATASDITLETYACTGKNGDTYTWSKNDNAMGARAIIGSTDDTQNITTSNQVSVTGFDFAANYVGTVTENGNVTYRGNKLVIKFNVTPRDGFLGGNNIYTNGSAGVYENANAETPVLTFEQPQVNVPIDAVTVIAEDKNVYLLGGLTAAQLKEGAVVQCGDVTLSLAPDATNFGLEAWQTEYVNITVEVKDKDGNVIATGLTNLTDDTTYTISVTVAPKETASTASSGTAAETKTGTNSPAANINVFKPELTFKDSEVYYGDAVPTAYSNNLTGTVWKHGDMLSTAEGVSMIGTAPTLSLTYTPDSTKIADGKVNTKQDIPVDVTVNIGSTDVTTHATFLHTDCTGKTCTVPDGKEFLLHVKTCQLTIAKTGGADGEPYVFNVYKDGTRYSEVTIWGNGTETLVELPVGEYSIAEDTGWSWRYNADDDSSAILSADSPTGTITCTNSSNGKIYWLNGFSQVVRNIFGISH